VNFWSCTKRYEVKGFVTSMLKSALKRLLPERVRLLRYELERPIKYIPRLVASLGRGVECPFCGWQFRKFLAGGVESPLFAKIRVIPSGKRPNAGCPFCDSNDRERFLFLYLKNKTDLFSRPLKVLHLAPEPCLRKYIARHSPAHYVTADLSASGVSMLLDITAIPFPEASIDMLICNHVLEHVPDDRKAMSELFRVLKPGGRAIVQVPMAPDLSKTLEDPSVQSPAERLRVFGQDDHVRLYGPDYFDRLRAAGFQVAIVDYQAELGANLCRRYALIEGEQIFEVRKNASC
jgi:SAM-dependent methyltransferase